LQAKGEKEAASDTQSQAEREESQIAYELSRTIKKIAEPVGEIKRISIAVLVDGRYERVKGEKQEEIKYIPRTEKEIQDIRNLVARACGLEESRGDKIEVLNMPFETEPFTDETPIIEKMERRELYLAAAKYGFYALIFISFLLFFLRPILGLLKARNELPYGVRDVVVREATEARALEEKRQEELPEAMKNKELVSAIVKAWVREGT
jgi:flagellar M-ring protein FliF